MESDERSQLLKEISKTGIIPSIKAQMKMAVYNKLLNRKNENIVRKQTKDTEIINNIILEFLFKSGLHSTASVFFSESCMHQLPREAVIEEIKIPNSPGTIIELLVTPVSQPSIETQTEYEDINTKLIAVDEDLRRKRKLGRALSSEDMLRKGMDEIEKEIERQFNSEVQRKMEMFRASELADLRSLEEARFTSKMDMMKKEFEADLRTKTNELRIRFDRSADVLRAKQRELELEISKWAEKNIRNVNIDSTTIEVKRIMAEADEKAKQIKAKNLVLSRKLEKDLCKLEDEQLEHRKTKREVEKLRLAIAMLEQNSG